MPGLSRPIIMILMAGAPGAGKTFSAVNLALAFSLQGKRVMLLDMNPHPENCGKVLNLAPEATLRDFIEGKCPLKGIIRRGFGLEVIFCASGDASPPGLIIPDRNKIGLLRQHFASCDVMVVDCGNQNSMEELALPGIAPLTLMVSTPEPDAVTAVYALVKAMVAEHLGNRISLLLNRVRDERAALEAANNFEAITLRFLERKYELLEMVPETEIPFNPVFGSKPLMVSDANNPASKKFLAAARKLAALRNAEVRLSENIVRKLIVSACR